MRKKHPLISRIQNQISLLTKEKFPPANTDIQTLYALVTFDPNFLISDIGFIPFCCPAQTTPAPEI